MVLKMLMDTPLNKEIFNGIEMLLAWEKMATKWERGLIEFKR